MLYRIIYCVVFVVVHRISYYRFVLYCIVSYRTISLISYCKVSYLVVCCVVLCRIASYISYYFVSFCIVSSVVSYCIAYGIYHIVSYAVLIIHFISPSFKNIYNGLTC